MNNLLLLGRSLHMNNMRIVRSVATSFFKFLFMLLREIGAFTPALIVFVTIFSLGMFYSDYHWVSSLSELKSRGSELNLCPASY